MWEIAIVIVGALWFFFRHRYGTHAKPMRPAAPRPGRSDSPSEPAEEVSTGPVRLAGDGHYAIEVVGESKYPKSFEAIFGPRSRDGVNMSVRAVLTLEDDNAFDKYAVRVSIEGHTVGYLPRIAAQAFRRAVTRVGHGRTMAFECGAVIRGGWDRGPSDRGNYGVKLDIP